jgi:3-oxoadipate enol-lactonase
MLLSIGGRRLYYDLAGAASAPTVCFTHSLASDSGMWAEQLPVLLAGGFRVLRLDMRGHGGSEAVAGDYTMDALAGDVAAAVEALGVAPVHYIGLSIGGMIGQAFALKHGTLLRSLMLCDTLPATPPGAREAWQPRVASVTKASSLAPIAEATMERWFTDAFKPRDPGRWRQIHDTIVGTTPQGFLGCAAAIQNFDFLPRLPSLKLPTLVVCGAEDQGTPASENRRIASLVPGARYVEIAAARHLPNVEQAETFNRAMMGWLSGQGR